MRRSTITLTLDAYGHLMPGSDVTAATGLGTTVLSAWSPDTLEDRLEIDEPSGRAQRKVQHKLTATACECLPIDAAGCEGSAESRSAVEEPKAMLQEALRPEVACFFRAEGTGLEPATGYPATDFESVRIVRNTR